MLYIQASSHSRRIMRAAWRAGASPGSFWVNSHYRQAPPTSPQFVGETLNSLSYFRSRPPFSAPAGKGRAQRDGRCAESGVIRAWAITLFLPQRLARNFSTPHLAFGRLPPRSRRRAIPSTDRPQPRATSRARGGGRRRGTRRASQTWIHRWRRAGRRRPMRRNSPCR